MAGRIPLGVQLTEAQTRAERAEKALEDFKRLVLEKAQQVQKDMNWCRSGFNAVMEDLGLPKQPEAFKLRFKVIATQVVDVEVSAEDLEGAEYSVDVEGAKKWIQDNDDPADYIDVFSWETTSDAAMFLGGEAVAD